jgi:hypothetical protein
VPKGPRDTRFEQMGKSVIFRRCSCFVGALSASVYVGLACMQNRRVVRKVVSETDSDWRPERRLLVQHNLKYQVYIARAI